MLRGRDVRAFALNPDPRLVLFPYRDEGDKFVLLTPAELNQYPAAVEYLKKHRKRLSKRVWFDKSARELSGEWYGLMYVEARRKLTRTHLLTPSLSRACNFALGSGDLFATGTAGVTSLVLKKGGYDPLFFLAVLNSSLVRAWVHGHSPVFQGGFRKFSGPYLQAVPIALPDLTTQQGREVQMAVV